MTVRAKFNAALVLLAMTLVPALAHASVVLSGTRVIYEQKEREVTLKLSNEGNLSALVQTWIDDGNVNALPDEVSVPFTLTPPLFRVDPKKGQALRIIYSQDPLASDRESLFWLNVLEIPPQAAASPEAPNSLQLAFRTRIKLFFRPTGLPGDPAGAAAQMTWRFVRKDDNKYVLVATNPSPFHVTISKVATEVGGVVWRNDTGAMVAPRATAEFDVGPVTHINSEVPTKVDFMSVNDYGAGVEGVFPAQQLQKP
ncbi:fimbria/pilus periplasmic chaperone [Pigmentiphaga sp. YJ18]|uniref:fimbria/pilus periplasmic chaperone n=1 Tax=Pigmentiphaga sp. YJ18 TaxID=3134907 RepID=UPI003115DE6A